MFAALTTAMLSGCVPVRLDIWTRATGGEVRFHRDHNGPVCVLVYTHPGPGPRMQAHIAGRGRISVEAAADALTEYAKRHR